MLAMRAGKENKLFSILYRLIYDYKRQPITRDTEIDRVNYYGVCIVYMAKCVRDHRTLHRSTGCSIQIHFSLCVCVCVCVCVFVYTPRDYEL